MVKNFTNTEKLGFVAFVVVIIFLVGMSYVDWVTLDSDFSMTDGVLRVRGAYSGVVVILWLLGFVSAVYIFVKGAAWARLDSKILAFMIVWLVGWVGSLPWMTHAFPSLVRSSKVVQVRQDVSADVGVLVYFDVLCIVSTRVCADNKDYDVVVLLKHSPGCYCRERIQREDGNWPDVKISSEQYFLKSNKFPFNAGVFACAIATGTIDMSKQGLNEGVFNATR